MHINRTKIRRLYYHFSHNYLTLNNLVVAGAFIVGLSWVWGSISVMERNYALQKQIDELSQQKTLGQLQVELLQYQQKYYNTDEYKELAVRSHLGLAQPGEKLLILPPNSQAALDADNPNAPSSKQKAKPTTQPSNMQQWLTFLFGGASKGLNNSQ